MLKEKSLIVAAPPARSTRMHARGHDYYRTTCPDRCDLVIKWAARRLITPRAFLLATRAGRDWEEIAALLGVSTADVAAYLAALDPDEWLTMMSLIGRDLRGKA